MIHRDPWRLELYQHAGQSMQRTAAASVESEQGVHCNIVPIDCSLMKGALVEGALVAGQPRPRIQVDHRGSHRSWTI